MAASTFEHPALPDFATPTLVTGTLLAAAQMLVIWEMRARTRAALRRVPGERLPDIGLTTAEMLREVAKPFWRP